MQDRNEAPDIVKTEEVSKLQRNLNPIQLFESPECSICISTITDEMFVLKCGHFYHKECISEHLKMKQECPTCRTKLANEHPYVIMKSFLQKANVKAQLSSELKGRMNFSLAKSMYSNLKYVCGICQHNVFESDISITNCHHLCHTECLKKVQKNGELYQCPDCEELRPTTSRNLNFHTKDYYTKKMPTSLEKYKIFAKEYQASIDKFKLEFQAQEHQFIEKKSEMVTALGLKLEIFNKLDNIRPINESKRYDTFHYYLEKG